MLHGEKSRIKVVTDFLTENRIATLPHPAYSPDLAPTDFWLFAKLKNSLGGTNYPSCPALGSAILQWFKRGSKESFAGAYRDSIKWWQLCIDKEGDYVEK